MISVQLYFFCSNSKTRFARKLVPSFIDISLSEEIATFIPVLNLYQRDWCLKAPKWPLTTQTARVSKNAYDLKYLLPLPNLDMRLRLSERTEASLHKDLHRLTFFSVSAFQLSESARYRFKSL
jgi:hypothetical protein